MFRNYLLRGHTKLIEEGVMPNLLHVVPVGDDTVLNGELEMKHASFCLGIISHVKFCGRWTWTGDLLPTHKGREDGFGLFISCESGFDRVGSVINDQCLNIVVTHPDKKSQS